MANEISVVVKMQEDLTGKFKSIASTAQGCSKEFERLQRKVEDLGKRYEDFNKKSASLSAEALSVKKAMDEAKNAFAKTQDEADKANYEKLKAQYDELTTAAKQYSKAAQDTVKDMNDVNEEARKLADGGGKGLNSNSIGIKEFGERLRNSGLLQQASGSVSSAISTYATSAIGQPMATAISETVSGTISGVAAGAVAGIPGMIIGGISGTLAGALNGRTQIYQQQDDAFKAYYAGLYDTVNANTTESLTSGKELAKRRETTRTAFVNELGAERADRLLADIQTTANATPFLYDELTDLSRTLLSFGTAAENIIPTLTKVGDAGAAKGLAASDISTVASYLGKMQSSDRATREFLDPLMERGFAVFDWLAEAKGTDQAGIYDMLSKGDLSGKWVSDVILGKFEALYGGMMAEQSRTTEGLESTLQGLRENIQNAGGDAYNKTRQDAYSADIAAYGGELGEALATAYAAGGEAQAYGENLRDQYLREALDVVLNAGRTSLYTGEDAEKLAALHNSYTNAYADYTDDDADEETRMLAAKKMEDLRETAEALAAETFESSEWTQKLDDTENEQIDAIRENTVGLYAATRELEKTDRFSVGQAGPAVQNKLETFQRGHSLLSGALKQFKQDGSHAYGLGYVPFDGYKAVLHQGERVLTAAESRSLDAAGRAWESPPSFAYGLKYAPFDGFPAVLHQGERVLAAQEARGAGDGGRRAVNITVNVTGNTVRSQEDLDELVERFAAALEEKAMLFGG